MPCPNIADLTKARQDLPLLHSEIGALEPSLCRMIIHAALTLLAYLNRKKNNLYMYIYSNKSKTIMVDNSNNEIITIIDK